MAYVTRICENCGRPFQADSRNVARGWGKCCSKSCAADLREKDKAEPQPERKYGFDEFIGECYEPVRPAGTEKPRLTFDELVARANATKEKAKPRHIESHIQRNCFYWFGLQYPHLRPVFFAVPNGGGRNKREAGILKAEGVTAGVADAILLKPSGGYASLCVEFKTEEGTQRRTQKEWQKAAEANGNKYVIVRSFDDFKREVTEYLGAV